MLDESAGDPGRLAAYFALMEVGGQLRHAVEQQLRRDGDLSYVQFQILATLNDFASESPRMTDVADRLVLSRSALTYQVAQLERRSLLERSSAIDDERSMTLALTDAGRGRVQKVLPGHVELVRTQLIDPLTEDDLRALERILGRIRDRMRSGPPRSAQRRRPASSVGRR